MMVRFIKLTSSGSGWTENTPYGFQGGSDGKLPGVWGLIFDTSGNLYGTTVWGGAGGGGTVFQLIPSAGSWTFNLLYSLSGSNGGGPWNGPLIMDSAGNLYGTTAKGKSSYGFGNVFELSPSNGGWTYTSLHQFTGGSDGKDPYGGVVLDAGGNLYGTTGGGGAYGYGVVWEITP